MYVEEITRAQLTQFVEAGIERGVERGEPLQPGEQALVRHVARTETLVLTAATKPQAEGSCGCPLYGAGLLHENHYGGLEPWEPRHTEFATGFDRAATNGIYDATLLKVVG